MLQMSRYIAAGMTQAIIEKCTSATPHVNLYCSQQSQQLPSEHVCRAWMTFRR